MATVEERIAVLETQVAALLVEIERVNKVTTFGAVDEAFQAIPVMSSLPVEPSKLLGS
jgi:uncharacterized coiled-coil protein SlyX